MTLTFRDFTFRAQHHVVSKWGAAALPHWHTYVVRMYFKAEPDQDQLVKDLERQFAHLHGASLNTVIEGETTDERVAEWFLKQTQERGCVRVVLTNDYQRGAEVIA